MPLVYLLYGGRKEVIRFAERAELAGIKGISHELVGKRVRHVGVGPGRRGVPEADGLGSCQEYRRHYGVVTTTYQEGEFNLPKRLTMQEFDSLLQGLFKEYGISGYRPGKWAEEELDTWETDSDPMTTIGAIMVPSPPATTRKSSRSRRRKSKSRAIDD